MTDHNADLIPDDAAMKRMRANIARGITPHRFTRRKSFVVTSSVILALLGIVGGGAYAAQTVMVSREEPALAADAAIIAESWGISTEQAIDALKEGNALGPIVGEIRSLVGSREISIDKTYVPAVTLTVRISGDKRIPGLQEIVDRSPSPVIVSYLDLPGITELNNLLLEATPLWKSEFPGITRTTVDDSDPTRVLVFVDKGALPTADMLRAVSEAVPESVRISVTVEDGWAVLD